MPGDKKHHTEKFRRCIEKVEAQGNVENAYAVCTAALQKAGEPIFEGAESRSAEEIRLLAEHAPELHQLHLCGATGQVRTEMLNGREHLIVPVVALMEGVIHAVNADTPEFVPWETIERIAESFNGKPVTLGHPVKDGRQCSATVPGVIDARGIGFIRNSRAVKESKRLLQEACIDKVRTKQLHSEMYQRLLDGKVEEVSVGAWIVTDDKASTHNGNPYKAQWLAGYGDHLAFLPGGRGACSVAMGCGAHRAAMLVTAEGFVDVPEVMPVLAFTTLEETSLNERMDAIYRAVRERWNGQTMTVEQQIYAEPMSVFDDHVMVRIGSDVLDVPYTVKDGRVTLGEAKRVKQAWVAAARKAKYEDCPTCKGSGNMNGNPCETCDGMGELRHAALVAMLGLRPCSNSAKDIYGQAMKALGDRSGHPFYGNQHVVSPEERVPEADKKREEVEKFLVLADRIRFEGGWWNLFGSDNRLRLGQYKTREEAEEHGRKILEHLGA